MGAWNGKQEETLCTGTYAGVGLHLGKQRAGDVEEVERHAIHNHGEDEHPESAAGITPSEQGKTEYPGKHADEHDPFDAEVLQEEGNGQNKKGLAHLRDGEQDDRVLYSEGVGKLGYGGKRTQEEVAIGVCNLQGGT